LRSPEPWLSLYFVRRLDFVRTLIRLKANIMKNNFLALIFHGLLALCMASCDLASTEKVSVPVVPDGIKVPQNEVLSFAANAKGVQIYECRVKKDTTAQYEWVLKAPEAGLFDGRGKRIGRHYGGPTWESNDGSKVIGEVKGSEPSTDAKAIPWLLLQDKTHEGNGIFSRVNIIQRLETVGGKPPAEGCDQSGSGKELRVPYTAVYYFYASKL